MNEDEDLGEHFVDLLAAIYEATCADCDEAHPTQFCCQTFLCRDHYIAHAYFKHKEVA